MPWPLHHHQQMDRHRLAGMQAASCVRDASADIPPRLPTAPLLLYILRKLDENSFVMY